MSRPSSLRGLARQPASVGALAVAAAFVLLLAAFVAALVTGPFRIADLLAVLAWAILVGVAVWYGLERG